MTCLARARIVHAFYGFPDVPFPIIVVIHHVTFTTTTFALLLHYYCFVYVFIPTFVYLPHVLYLIGE